MKSFDYFDTLVCRLVFRPTDVFQILEEQLEWPGFAQARITAELRARKRQAGREVTLRDIYEQLLHEPTQEQHHGLALTGPEASRERALHSAMQTELRLERALASPIAANLRRLQAGDLVVSDIYLPAAELAAVLARCGVQPAPRVITSCEVGVRKAEGGLWDWLLTNKLKPLVHRGDNFHSDVRQARRRDLRAEHDTSALPTRHERQLADGSLEGSIVAGCARAARLASGHDEASWQGRLHTVFSNAVAPALTAFVDHVLDECVRLGIRTVAFLARDGQLLHRIAQLRVRQRALALELRYVYGSRQALHVPGFTGIGSAQTWLLEDTPELRLQDVAARAELPLPTVEQCAKAVGLSADPSANLDAAARHQLPTLIRHAAFVQALQAQSHRRWQAADAYYRAQGFGGERSVALVDVGWNGRMQASLHQILAKSPLGPGAPLHGYYFCLRRKLKATPSCQLEGYAFDPERDSGANLLDGHRAMIESLLEADHGSTLRFELQAGGPHAVLADPPTGQALEAVQVQQAAVLAFVAALGQAEQAVGRRVPIPKGPALRCLGALLARPTAGEAGAFHWREHADAHADVHADVHADARGGTQAQALVRHLRFGPDLVRRERMGFWPEGSLSLSGWGWALPLVAAARQWRRARAHVHLEGPAEGQAA
jgi:predicted HAD superfamily hydrolase